MRSARARWWRGAGFFFELVLALVARGMFSLLVKRLALRAGSPAAWGRFFLSVKWLCAPRGCACGVGQVFSFGQMALRSARARGRAGFFFELVLALVARGMFFFRSNGLRSARARGREGCFDSPLPTSGLHSPRNELRAARP